MSKEENKKHDELDWESLEREDRLAGPQKDVEDYDINAIEAEKQNLTEEDKSSPYPDDFLADINLLNKSIKNSQQKFKTEAELDEEEEE
ncbi:hypothetical protein [Chondrinema litorale]|uniref:hypothetical protein n=1 Tax=Chondrinema litorale TaxID=2994555 RepID=UPI0025432FED|nr:hypothetical protein [Chondrinema litorale]UZR94247.1 hypothetical protein OQ292_00230 [Chondrinema litorale]